MVTIMQMIAIVACLYRRIKYYNILYAVHLQSIKGVYEFWPGNVTICKKFWRLRYQRVVHFDAIFGLIHIEITAVVEQYQHFL